MVEDAIRELIDEVVEVEGFKVVNDSSADWCLDKIREQEAEIKRFDMAVNHKVAMLREALEKRKYECERTIEFFNSKLYEYFRGLKINPNKSGNYIYKLPTGKLEFKKQQPEFRRDNDKLLKYCEQNTEFLRVKKEPDWVELKKVCRVIEGGKVVDPNGEIVDGVEAIERDMKFDVKV